MLNFIIAGIFESLCLLKKKRKELFIFFLAFLWCICWGKEPVQDRFNYFITYLETHEINASAHMGILFQAFILICKKLSLSFYTYLAILMAIFYTLFAIVILKLSIYPNFVLALYFLYPFIVDADQFRSFIGMSIVFYGFTFVLTKQKHAIKKYSLCCLIASAFHTTCLFFFVYILIPCISAKKCKKVVFISIIAILTLRTFFVKALANLPSLNEGYVQGYITSFAHKNHWLISMFYFGLIMLLTMFMCKQYSKYILKRKLWYSDCYIDVNVVEKLNILSFIAFPLFLMDDHATRLTRLVLIIDYIIITNFTKNKPFAKYNKEIRLFLVLFAGSRFLMFLIGDGWKVYMETFFINGFSFF